jgi:hypothetical protein
MYHKRYLPFRYSNYNFVCIYHPPWCKITVITLGEDHKIQSSSLSNFLRPPIFCFLGWKIQNTLFSYTFSLYSFLRVRNRISHPHKRRGRIEFYLCI